MSVDVTKARGIESVEAALRATWSGRASEEVCPVCDGLIVVDSLPPHQPTQWRIWCPCGRCNGIMKGL